MIRGLYPGILHLLSIETTSEDQNDKGHIPKVSNTIAVSSVETEDGRPRLEAVLVPEGLNKGLQEFPCRWQAPRYNGGIILYLCKAVNYIQETFLRLNIANGKIIIPTFIELDVGYKEVHVPGILIWMTVMCAISTPTSPKG